MYSLTSSQSSHYGLLAPTQRSTEALSCLQSQPHTSSHINVKMRSFKRAAFPSPMQERPAGEWNEHSLAQPHTYAYNTSTIKNTPALSHTYTQTQTHINKDAKRRTIIPIRQLDDYYLIGARLNICEQTNNPSRPVLRNAVHIESMEPRIVKMIDKSKVPAAAGGDRLWRRLCENLLNMPPHKNVMNVYDVFEDGYRYYIVLERFEGVELFDFLLNERAVPEMMCKYITRQMLLAVSHMHAHNLLHRDIKPENVMFKYDRDLQTDQFEQHAIALVDFDTCRMTDVAPELYNDAVGGRRRLVGTYGYLAPEVLKGGEYTKASDMWSVGIILYILMTGVPPIPMDRMNSAKESLMTLNKVETEGIDFDLSPLPQFSKARDLCIKLLAFDPNRRMSAAVDALAHPWVCDKTLMRGMAKSHRSAISGHAQTYTDVASNTRCEESEAHISHPFWPHQLANQISVETSSIGTSSTKKFDDVFKVRSPNLTYHNSHMKKHGRTDAHIHMHDCCTPSTATPGSRPHFRNSHMKFDDSNKRDSFKFTDCSSSPSDSWRTPSAIPHTVETPVAHASNATLKTILSNSNASMYDTSPPTCAARMKTHPTNMHPLKYESPDASVHVPEDCCKKSHQTCSNVHAYTQKKSHTHKFIAAIPKVGPRCLHWIWDKKPKT